MDLNQIGKQTKTILRGGFLFDGFIRKIYEKKGLTYKQS